MTQTHTATAHTGARVENLRASVRTSVCVTIAAIDHAESENMVRYSGNSWLTGVANKNERVLEQDCCRAQLGQDGAR